MTRPGRAIGLAVIAATVLSTGCGGDHDDGPPVPFASGSPTTDARPSGPTTDADDGDRANGSAPTVADNGADPGAGTDTDAPGVGADASRPADDDPSSAAPQEFEPLSLEWNEYDDGIDIARLTVPVDYADPDGDQFELAIARHRALDAGARIGSLLVNPGGPGRAGLDYAVFAAGIFGPELLERFDIVAWDPRGTGQSVPAIDCIDDYDPYFTAVDSTPETPEEHDEVVSISRAFADSCAERNGAILEHVGTNNSARDIDSIRRALGEETISYFGFSYGSELGATWATLFPETVRAAVLDGGIDPDADDLDGAVQQMSGFEAALETFLARCGEAPTCEFSPDGDPTAAYVDLLESLDAEPLLVDAARPPVNRDVAAVATIQALYSDSSWPALERALADARAGDGGGLLALYDGYYRRRSDGTYSNFLEAFQAIACADTAERVTVEEADAQIDAIIEVAPLLVPEGSTGSYFCTFFPPAVDPRVDLTADGAGPIVVIATTGDPATPFQTSVALADALQDGHLVAVVADQHLGYGVNGCVNQAVERYLIDLEVPVDDTRCE